MSAVARNAGGRKIQPCQLHTVPVDAHQVLLLVVTSKACARDVGRGQGGSWVSARPNVMSSVAMPAPGTEAPLAQGVFVHRLAHLRCRVLVAGEARVFPAHVLGVRNLGSPGVTVAAGQGSVHRIWAHGHHQRRKPPRSEVSTQAFCSRLYVFHTPVAAKAILPGGGFGKDCHRKAHNREPPALPTGLHPVPPTGPI